jgi:hypothetical protein
MSNPELGSVQCILKTVFNPASLTGSYQVMNGATGTSDDCKMLLLYNGSTTVSIDISFDGVNSHMFIPPLGTQIFDFQTNHADGPPYGSGTKYLRAGQLIWGKTAESPTFLQMVGFR